MCRFSVLMPVRNGGHYVQESIQSILSQTYTDFELHVLDNASTDGTVAWVEGIQDPRIRVWTSDESLSIEDSWARIKKVPKKEFMTFLGHDDILEPQFLEIINDLIVKFPDASLYETGSRLINAKGKTIRRCMPVSQRESASQYLASRLTYQRDALGTGFVMRSKDYDRLGGIPGFEKLLFADDALWLSLSNLSWKAADPREAFAVRIHADSMSALPAWPSTIVGLNQFTDFLDQFTKEDGDSKDVYREHGPAFMKRYHRNVYICSLLEACRQKQRIDESILPKIETSLVKNSPAPGQSVRDSLAVRILEAANRTVFKSFMSHLWDAYYLVKTKSLY